MCVCVCNIAGAPLHDAAAAFVMVLALAPLRAAPDMYI